MEEYVVIPGGKRLIKRFHCLLLLPIEKLPANQLDDQIRPLPRLAPITLTKPSIKSFAVAPNCDHDDSQSEERDRPDFRQDVRQMVSFEK